MVGPIGTDLRASVPYNRIKPADIQGSGTTLPGASARQAAFLDTIVLLTS